MQSGKEGQMGRKMGAFFGKIGKDRFLIMALAGILLFVIAVPAEPKKSGEAKSGELLSETQPQAAQEDAHAKDGEEMADYVAQLEKRLADALTYMDGAGSVKVMITLRSSAEKVIEKDTPGNRSATVEADAQGGSRSIHAIENEETTVYVTGENGERVPYVIKSIEPTVEGVVVVAQGAGSAQVRKNITEAVQALFSIEAHKIKVVKMKR